MGALVLSASSGLCDGGPIRYRVVARHREFASMVTTALWGRGEEAVCRSTYYHARRWFLRLLGAVYLIAFASFWSQVDGLIGHSGILPVAPWLEELRNRFGTEALSAISRRSAGSTRATRFFIFYVRAASP